MHKLLVCLFISVFSFISLHANSNSHVLGKQWLQKIKTEFQNGEYNEILTEIHQTRSEQENQNTQNLEEMFSSPQFIAGIKEILNWCEKNTPEFLKLSEEMNQSLLKIAKAYPHEFVSEVIQSYQEMPVTLELSSDFKALIFQSFTEKNEKNSNYDGQDWKVLREFLIERQIVGVEFARQCKRGKENDEIDLSDLKKYFVILALDKMRKVSDLEIPAEKKNKLKDLFSQFINKKTAAHDFDYLSALGGNGSTEAEIQVAKVIKTYKERVNNLYKTSPLQGGGASFLD